MHHATPGAHTTVLRREGKLGPETTKTVTELSFEVPANATEIALLFDYQPRQSLDREVNRRHVEQAFAEFSASFRARMGDAWAEGLRTRLGVDRMEEALNNLLNVVLIDADGNWRGRWDRNPASTDGRLRVGIDEASPGFIAGPLPQGTWRAAIECHGIYGQPVSFSIDIEAATTRKASGANDPSPRFTVPLPAPEGPARWYVGEMHSHSTESDGSWSIPTLCDNVARDGAQFIFLTDHNTMSGHRNPPDVSITLIPGCELTTFFGHYPTYGVESAPVWHENGRVRHFEAISAEVRSRGGLIGAAHPFVPGDPLCTGCRMRADLDPSHIDTMEVWYRRWDSPGADNEAAYALWNRFWREGHRITAVGARDVHRNEQLHPFPGEMPFTAIRADANTPSAIFAGLRRREVIVTGGPLLDLQLLGESAVARIGEELHTKPKKLKVHISRAEQGQELRLFFKGEVFSSLEAAGDGQHEIDLPSHVQQSGWFRAELRNKAGLPRAITNHALAV